MKNNFSANFINTIKVKSSIFNSGLSGLGYTRGYLHGSKPNQISCYYGDIFATVRPEVADFFRNKTLKLPRQLENPIVPGLAKQVDMIRHIHPSITTGLSFGNNVTKALKKFSRSAVSLKFALRSILRIMM